MAARGSARPGELVEWKSWIHDPFGPDLEMKMGLVIGDQREAIRDRGLVVDVLLTDGTVRPVGTHKLKVISKPYVKYRGIT